MVLGMITSYYLTASSLWTQGCNEATAPYLVLPVNEAWWSAPCLWDAVYIIRGSYLTYLWPCIRPVVSEYVCVYGRSSLSVCVSPRADFIVVTPLRCSCGRLSVSGCRPYSTLKSWDASSHCSGASELSWRGSSLSGWEKHRSASRYSPESFIITAHNASSSFYFLSLCFMEITADSFCVGSCSWGLFLQQNVNSVILFMDVTKQINFFV